MAPQRCLIHQSYLGEVQLYPADRWEPVIYTDQVADIRIERAMPRRPTALQPREPWTTREIATAALLSTITVLWIAAMLIFIFGVIDAYTR